VGTSLSGVKSMIMIEQVKKTPIPLDRNELVLNTWYMVSNTPDMQKRKIGTLVIKIGSEMIAFVIMFLLFGIVQRDSN
jgi:hypothetical protein